MQEFGPMRSSGFIVLPNHTCPPTINVLILHPLIGITMLVQGGWGYNSLSYTSLEVVGSQHWNGDMGVERKEVVDMTGILRHFGTSPHFV